MNTSPLKLVGCQIIESRMDALGIVGSFKPVLNLCNGIVKGIIVGKIEGGKSNCV